MIEDKDFDELVKFKQKTGQHILILPDSVEPSSTIRWKGTAGSGLQQNK